MFEHANGALNKGGLRMKWIRLGMCVVLTYIRKNYDGSISLKWEVFDTSFLSVAAHGLATMAITKKIQTNKSENVKGDAEIELEG